MQGDSSQPERVQAVDYQLPMSYKFLESSFYVRECYDEYYNYITSTLNSPRMDYVSVTGTPGTRLN
jgi:hypothetical protein